MFKLLLALSMGACCVTPLAAAEIHPASLSCQVAEEPGRCEKLKTDFTAAYTLAYKGNHGAQATVAFCLSTGCRGAVIVDKVAACSWHIVIANSGAATVLDGSNLKDVCRPMTEEQKTAARALSHDLVRKIYKRSVTAADQM
jgi:hypothetical protein